MEVNENQFYDLLILYGSQTGTAKFASEELQRELHKLNFTSKISEMDSYSFINLPEENFIIFIISTTGYGEFPSNSKNFWNFLMRKDLPENSLENVNYTVFGLGDSSYEKFNQCAKLLNSRLHKLSANLIHPVALGDEQHDFGFEAEFDPWVKSLIEELLCYFPEKVLFYEKNRSFFELLKEKVGFDVELFNQKIDCFGKEGFFENGDYDYDKFDFGSFYLERYIEIKRHSEAKLFEEIESNKIAFIKRNDIITSEDSFKTVFNVALEIKRKQDCDFKIDDNKNNDFDKKEEVLNNKIKSANKINFLNSNNVLIEKINTEIFYNFANEKIKKFTRCVEVELKDKKNSCANNVSLLPGDSALLFPENDFETVSKFMKIINLKEDDFLIFKYENSNFNSEIVFPFIVNAKEFVKKWLNINGYPNRFFCYIASLFTEEPVYKEKLELFASKSSEGKDEFYRYTGKYNRSYVEFLTDFKTTKIPLNYLFYLIGRLPYREYSISKLNDSENNNKSTSDSLNIELTIGFSENYNNITEKTKVGLISKFIQEHYFNSKNHLYQKGFEVHMLFRKGNFPNIGLDKNAIFICTGTGIAPIRFYLWRRFEKYQRNKSLTIGKTILIYGCRNKLKDYLYEEELEVFKNEKNFNFENYVAFSRDQEQKVYVQNIIKEHSKLIKEMIFDKNAYIVLVGNSKILPKYVDKALCFALKKESEQFKNFEDEDIIKYLSLLKNKNIYYTETW